MRLNEVDYGGAQPIDGYGPGFFRVGGEVIHGGVLALPGQVSPWDGFEDLERLMAAAGEIDVLFLGTGAEIAHPPTSFRETLDQAGIGLEVMASPTAARSYNVILSEGRRIGAALLPV